MDGLSGRVVVLSDVVEVAEDEIPFRGRLRKEEVDAIECDPVSALAASDEFSTYVAHVFLKSRDVGDTVLFDK